LKLRAAKDYEYTVPSLMVTYSRWNKTTVSQASQLAALTADTFHEEY